MSTVWRESESRESDPSVTGLRLAHVQLSCETFERELSEIRARSAVESAPPLLTRSQRQHLEGCTACRREFAEGSLTGALGARVAKPVEADPLFLPGVLAAIRDERPPIRQRERRIRRQWLAGATCVLIGILTLNVFWLPGGASSPASEPPAIRGGGSNTPRAALEATRPARVRSGDEFLLGYASEYLPCEFIPSGSPAFGDLTEVKF